MIIKGQKINDRYEIIRSIGEGGMANVYLAYDIILNRNVAVKILRGDLAQDEKFVKRFQREAIAASSLNHPNIVEMYDVGEDNGNYFIVMEYLEGQTLKSLIKRRGALTLSEVIDIMLQLTSGLACAHKSYIIHRDIKPQNIVILDDGEVKITDFGIASTLKASELTQTNSVMGSVHYLPPEQANGDTVTVKSDIYSAGILMYELLTGKLPFKGENAVEIAIKHMKEPIPSVVEFNPEIPQSVENIILKATAKNPQNRYNTVDEMYEDLKTCLDKFRSNEPKISYLYPEFNEEIKETREEKFSGKQDDEKEIKKEKKVNKVLVITTIITLILIFAALFIFIVFPAITSGKEVEVPDVTNMSVKEAEKVLEKKGFQVDNEVKEEKSDSIQVGNVTKTSPKASRTVKKNTTITIYVSTGSDKIKIENYEGQDFDTVKYTLEQAGLKVFSEEKEYKADDNIKNNSIVLQSIESGKEVEANTAITLTIAKVITVYPDFVNENYNLDQVQSFCDDNGITLEKVAKETNDVVENMIISQSRQAGSKVVSGVTLKVTYAIPKPITCGTNEELSSDKKSCVCKTGYVKENDSCVKEEVKTTDTKTDKTTDTKNDTTKTKSESE